MNNFFSKTITDQAINLICKYLKSYIVKSNNIHINYFFKTKNYTITIFKNKKLLIQGNNFENILKLIGENETVLINNDNNLDKATLIGSDESGTGDLFGGFVTCACFIPKQNRSAIKKLGVKDSKELDNKQIKILFEQLNKKIKYEIVNLDPEQYNTLYNKYHNINTIKVYAHHLAISKLCTNYNFDYIIVDQFCTKAKFLDHLKKINITTNLTDKIIFETKAENKYLEVAVASIIARYFFINQIEQLSLKLNINLPFGSTTKIVLPKLKLIDKKHYSNFCKLNFKTLQKI